MGPEVQVQEHLPSKRLMPPAPFHFKRRDLDSSGRVRACGLLVSCVYLLCARYVLLAAKFLSKRQSFKRSWLCQLNFLVIFCSF